MNANTCFIVSGEGEPVVCLLGNSAAALMDVLTGDFKVLAMPPDDMIMEALMAAAKARGLETFSLVVHGADATLALQLAAAYPQVVQALVLLSPLALRADATAHDAALSEQLPNVKAQVLALFGTRDKAAPPSMGGHYKRALANCHLMYVYDAEDTASERLEAVSEVVLDFLKRRDAFLVNNKDGRHHA